MICPDALMRSGGYANDSFAEVHVALPKASNWEMLTLLLGTWLWLHSLFQTWNINESDMNSLEVQRVFIVLTFFFLHWFVILKLGLNDNLYFNRYRKLLLPSIKHNWLWYLPTGYLSWFFFPLEICIILHWW